MPLRSSTMNFSVIDTTSGADSLFALEDGFGGSGSEYLSAYRKLIATDMCSRQRIYCAALFTRKFEQQNQQNVKFIGPYADEAKFMLERIAGQHIQKAA